MSEVAADLEVTSLTQHGLAFERVVGLALDEGSGCWAALAITWLEDGFPMAGQTDSLRRVITDKSVTQRPRQTAARLLAAQDRRNQPHPGASGSRQPP